MSKHKKTLALQNAVIKQAKLMNISSRIIRLLLIVLSILITALMFVVYQLLINRDYPPSYAVNYGTFDTAQVVRLNNPAISNEAVVRWSSGAVSDIFKLNFNNINQHLRDIQVYFSESGYNQFIADLTAKGWISDVRDKRLSFSANSCAKVNVRNVYKFKEEGDDKILWLIEIPLLFRIESPSVKRRDRYVVSVSVESGSKIRLDKSIAIVGIMWSSVSPLNDTCRLGRF